MQLSDVIGGILNGDFEPILIVWEDEEGRTFTFTPDGIDRRDVVEGLQSDLKLTDTHDQLN